METMIFFNSNKYLYLFSCYDYAKGNIQCIIWLIDEEKWGDVVIWNSLKKKTVNNSEEYNILLFT